MIRAVSAGAQPVSNRVQLKQDGVVASNSGPVPGGKKDGGGEMGSTCIMAFTGHKVQLQFSPICVFDACSHILGYS